MVELFAFLQVWVFFGFFGYLMLIGFRLLTEGKPEIEKALHLVPGFVFALVLGPLCYIFLAYLISEWLNDKTSNK